jgi:hypothetical protein
MGRLHCWATGPLGLGLSLYIVPHLLSVQHFTILHGIKLGFSSSHIPAAILLKHPRPPAYASPSPREAHPSLPGRLPSWPPPPSQRARAQSPCEPQAAQVGANSSRVMLLLMAPPHVPAPAPAALTESSSEELRGHA